jgi:hypothetical protein
MALNRLGRIQPSNLAQLTEHLEQTSERLTPDISSYARNRKRYWLQHEWDLKQRTFTPAIRDERLWAYCKYWMPQADLGLVVYGPIGIQPHRDDSYADWRAVGINLGTIDAWYYDCQYPDYRWTKNTNPSNPQHHSLQPGTVFEFNCKNPHAAINPAENRWAIFLWKLSPKFKQAIR